MALWTDEEVAIAVGRLLRAGVGTAAAVTALGGVLYLWRQGGGQVEYHAFRGAPPGIGTLDGILRGVAGLDPLAVIQFGLMLLIATPVARVALSLVGFLKERDRQYQAITLLVLGILLASLFGRI